MNKKNSGFTLIELVVVVAIIGVLAAIVTPKIRTSLMKAKDAKVVASLDALRTAANVYYAEKGLIPYAVVPTTQTAPTTPTAMNTGHLILLVKNGYLDKTSAQKLTTVTLDDALIATTPIANTTALIRQPVTSQDTAATANCNDDNGDSVKDPQGTAANTPGFAEYQWATDGIGLNVVTYATITGTTALGTAYGNTSCELWSSK